MSTQSQTATQSSSIGTLRLRPDDPAPRTGVVDGWWRGNLQGTVPSTRPGYPAFYDKTDEKSLLEKRKWVKEHLALCFRMWGDLGFAHGVSGHITVRDPILHDHFWMNPLGVHFSEITVKNLVLVDPKGYVTPIGAQLPINQAGFSIHSAVHHGRPEVNSAAHCHTQNGRAWSVFGKPLSMYNQDSCLLYKNQSVYLNGGKAAYEADEGEAIAKSLGEANAGILQNHGLITVGGTVDATVFLFNMMEKQCEIQLMVESAKAGGLVPTEIPEEDAEYTKGDNDDPEALYYELQPEIELYRAKYPDAVC